MFARVELRVSDLASSQRFYETVLGALGFGVSDRAADGSPLAWGEFALVQASAQAPPTRRLHIGFAARSRAAVGAFWEAGVDAGYPPDGRPGPRPQYVADYYGGFLLDPDGNSAEAVHHAGVRGDGAVDHLWIRVADLDAARGWYGTRAPIANWRTRVVGDTRVQVERAGLSGTFALVADGQPPTEHAHLAVFAAGLANAVMERDPDGNRVELRSSPAR